MAHLSIAEKENARQEHFENKKKIKKLSQEKAALTYLLRLKCSDEDGFRERREEVIEELKILRARNAKLLDFIQHQKYSKYGGMKYKDGVLYQMFGKKRSELTLEEKRAYDKVMQAKYRKQRREAKQQKDKTNEH